MIFVHMKVMMDDDSTAAAAAAAAAAVSFAGPQPSPLPWDEILPAPPQQPVSIPLQPAPPPLAALDGRTGVVLLLEGRRSARRFGVVGPHPAGSPTP